jgi:hypothetical protein
VGYLKKNPPQIGSPGFNGWQALISVLCPNRISVWGLMQNERSNQFNTLSVWVDKHVTEINLFAQRPFEFNTNEMRFTDDARERVSNYYTTKWLMSDREAIDGQDRLFER